jgi:hypothetical protein
MHMMFDTENGAKIKIYSASRVKRCNIHRFLRLSYSSSFKQFIQLLFFNQLFATWRLMQKMAPKLKFTAIAE